MTRLGRSLAAAAALFVFAAMTFFIAPRIGGWVKAYLIKQPETPSPQKTDTQTVGPFLSSFQAAAKYSISGLKRVIGEEEPYSMYFSCCVNGADFAVQTEKNGHKLRQLLSSGKYTLVDDTAKKIYSDTLYIDLPDKNIQQALTGKVVRSNTEMLNGTQVSCLELFKDGRIYAYYLNQLGSLVRYYYIYNGNEITIDFTKVSTGDVSGASFEIPPDYVPGDINEIKEFERPDTEALQKTTPQDAAKSASPKPS